MPEHTCPNCGCELKLLWRLLPLRVGAEEEVEHYWKCPRCGVTMCEGEKPVPHITGMEEAVNDVAFPPEKYPYFGQLKKVTDRHMQHLIEAAAVDAPLWRRLWWRIRAWWHSFAEKLWRPGRWGW